MAKKTKTQRWLAAKFPPPYDFHWRAGPYHAPVVNVGTILHDEFRGDVKVEGMSEAPVPWPAAHHAKGRRGALLPILYGDLVRAVCEEEELTVAHFWNVTRYMVVQWKRAIAGADSADGVFINLAMKRTNSAFRAKYGYK